LATELLRAGLDPRLHGLERDHSQLENRFGQCPTSLAFSAKSSNDVASGTGSERRPLIDCPAVTPG
jgi:hypothetical protein